MNNALCLLDKFRKKEMLLVSNTCLMEFKLENKIQSRNYIRSIRQNSEFRALLASHGRNTTSLWRSLSGFTWLILGDQISNQFKISCVQFQWFRVIHQTCLHAHVWILAWLLLLVPLNKKDHVRKKDYAKIKSHYDGEH